MKTTTTHIKSNSEALKTFIKSLYEKKAKKQAEMAARARASCKDE